MGIIVHEGGMLTTIQDLGRTGYQAQGMVVSGAMDPYAFQVANLLVGNSPKEAAIEITLMGPTLEATTDLIIAVTGADLGFEINGKSAPLWETLSLRKGDIIRFSGNRKRGARSYLAVQGGWLIEPVFDSYATYLMAGVGGYQGRALQQGDQLNIKKPIPTQRFIHRRLPPSLIPRYTKHKHVRVILGINQDSFTKEGIQTFLTHSYQITARFNRMGMRLSGPKIAHRKPADIISTTVTFGTIQVPANGQPIILLADRQTTGGYTQIANVITADLPLLGQSQAGESISFRTISIEKAQRLAIEQNRLLKQLEIHNWNL